MGSALPHLNENDFNEVKDYGFCCGIGFKLNVTVIDLKAQREYREVSDTSGVSRTNEGHFAGGLAEHSSRL